MWTRFHHQTLTAKPCAAAGPLAKTARGHDARCQRHHPARGVTARAPLQESIAGPFTVINGHRADGVQLDSW